MRRIFFYLLLLFSAVTYGQSIEQIIKQNRHQIDRVEVKLSDRITYISSNFAKPQITTINLRDKVKSLAVSKVYYVYTAYKKSPGFDQFKLDRQRFNELKSLYPILFENSLIEWEILEQTGLEIHTEGEGYFHGFILVHRPLPSKIGRQSEFEFVSRFLKDPESSVKLVEEDPISKRYKKKEHIVKLEIVDIEEAEYEGGGQSLVNHIQTSLVTPNDVWKDRKDFWAKFTLEIGDDGRPSVPKFKENYGKSVERAIKEAIAEMPPWHPKRINGIGLKDTVEFEWRISYSPQLKGMFLMNGKPPILDHKLSDLDRDPTQSNTIGAEDIVTSAVYQAFEKIPIDQKLAVVMDVTGSMANHIISATFWLHKNKQQLPFTSYTAFNDGDDQKNREKKIGLTGGIYWTNFFTEYSANIRTAMQNGNGGDYPENDIEAILNAISKDPKAQGVLLIADNMSSVKDIELLNKVDLPVHIMPCGLTGSINQNYLDIVSKTRGTIYYKDQVIDLDSLSRGDNFKIRRNSYVYTGKKIEVIEN
ncbi:MAG: hypothetical protein AB8B74_10725 [Crocinitomicaceae bacterium]